MVAKIIALHDEKITIDAVHRVFVKEGIIVFKSKKFIVFVDQVLSGINGDYIPCEIGVLINNKDDEPYDKWTRRYKVIYLEVSSPEYKYTDAPFSMFNQEEKDMIIPAIEEIWYRITEIADHYNPIEKKDGYPMPNYSSLHTRL